MGVCYNPRIFTPARERLSLGEWHALQTFLLGAAGIDPAAFALNYRSPIDPAVASLRALQADATRFISEVLPRAHAVGVTLADYGHDATRTFTAIVALLEGGGDAAAAVLSHLDELKVRASANAAAGSQVLEELQTYLRKATTTASALDAVVRGAPVTAQIGSLELQAAQIATLTQQRAASVNDDSHGKNTWWYDTQLSNLSNVPHDLGVFTALRALNDKLQAQLATATPSLEHVAGAWIAIAQELGTVVENARRAGDDALRQHECLAEIALTVATDEWNEVALDAASFAEAFYVKPASA
jgi:hypothetical protein